MPDGVPKLVESSARSPAGGRTGDEDDAVYSCCNLQLLFLALFMLTKLNIICSSACPLNFL